jgi:hypothetical protein
MRRRVASTLVHWATAYSLKPTVGLNFVPMGLRQFRCILKTH